jgi:hypothetical protein
MAIITTPIAWIAMVSPMSNRPQGLAHSNRFPSTAIQSRKRDGRAKVRRPVPGDLLDYAPQQKAATITIDQALQKLQQPNGD